MFSFSFIIHNIPKYMHLLFYSTHKKPNMEQAIIIITFLIQNHGKQN